MTPPPIAPPAKLRSLHDRILASIEATDRRTFHAVQMSAILGFSTGLSMLGGLVLPGLFGQPFARWLVWAWGLSGFCVALIVSLPAVWLGDALILRLRAMRERLSQALAEAEIGSRAKTEFLANMSHEIRTPLNGVLGMAQVLEATTLGPDQREALEVIRNSGDLLMAVIDDVLDLSKIEAGHVALRPDVHVLPEMLAATVALFRARAQQNGTQLALTVADGVPARVICDSVRVRQVVGNLVSNAVKFTSGGEVLVHLSAMPEGDGGWRVRVAVQDTGIGIAPEARTRLFQPFEQAGAGIAARYGGTGLGLAISRRLARLMGGDITLDSQLGRGSTFGFDFRAGPAPAERAPPPEAAPEMGAAAAPLRGRRILVVDDSRINRRVAAGLLRPLGAECLEAEDGPEALALLERGEIDLVLLDLQMPGMDGFEALMRIRTRPPPAGRVPVVALSADAAALEGGRAQAAGFQGSLTKPVFRRALMTELLRILPPENGEAGS
jgi:signal transduction histidine kinase